MHIRQNEHKNWYINRECRKNIFSIVYNSINLVFALEPEQSDFPNVFYIYIVKNKRQSLSIK